MDQKVVSNLRLMNLHYQLTEKDILQHQLYILSQSKSFQKRRAKGRMFLLLIYMITGMFIWQNSGPVVAAAFYLICLPFYFLYRKMEAKQYEKHIANYVKSQYQESLQHDFQLGWENQDITSSTGSGEHKLTELDLESIQELSSMYILNFRNTSALILPKSSTSDEVKSFLQQKADALGIPFEEKVAWKWK